MTTRGSAANSRLALLARVSGSASCVQRELKYKCTSPKGLALKRVSAEELNSMREDYHKSTSKVSEITAHFMPARNMFLTMEKQAHERREECRVIVTKEVIRRVSTTLA